MEAHERTRLLTEGSSTSIRIPHQNSYGMTGNERSMPLNQKADAPSKGDSFQHERSGKDRHEAVLVNEEDTLHIRAYRTTIFRTIFFYAASILTLGIFRLLLHWSKKWYIWFRAVGCTFEEADHIYIEDEHGTIDFCEIHKMKNRDGHDVVLPDGDGNYRTAHRPRFFTYRKVAFVWFADREEFLPISELDSKVPLETFYQILHAEKGLSDEEVSQRQAVYGKNLIEVVLRSILVLLFCEAISPFYIFQVFSVGIWYSDEYQIYASIIVLMSLTSISLDVIQTRKQETKLRSMVHSSGPVDVVRNGGQVTQLDSSQLVPGDTILVPQHGGMMHCDAVLMTGTVIINESMLTGESVPVTKVALTTSDDHQPEDTVARFDFSRHSKHVLYCGTQVLQTRYYGGKPVRAIVLRTAYSTTKGQLMSANSKEEEKRN